MSKKAILEACERAGGQHALARKIGLKSQGSISNAIAVGRVSPHTALRIEKATGVAREDLRPDIWPRGPRRRLRAA